MTQLDPRRGAILLLIPVLVIFVSMSLFPEENWAEENRQNAAPPAAAPDYAGMKAIPAGQFKMGIDAKTLIKMFGDPKKESRSKHPKLSGDNRDLWWNLIALETPEHRAQTEAYALDIYTVTNAQYRRFLTEATKGSFVTTQKVNTIALVAAEVHGGRTEELDEWNEEAIFWLNETKLTGDWEKIQKLNEAKIEAILAEFNEFRPERAHVKNLLELPAKQRVRAFVHFVLPAGINLTIFRRGVPDNWPKGVLDKEMENWPVVWVSAEDADAFAEWAGKHVPTEEEWEKAARGPNALLYPWGKAWQWNKEPNRLVWLESLPENPTDPKKGGPAAPHKDRPVDVSRCPDGVSPYGMFHMLGNVREWTSSIPSLYKGSKATPEKWFGKKSYRVLRSTSYGDGSTSGDGDGKKFPYMELIHRTTARALHGSRGGIGTAERLSAVGFRCAKYPQASRDVLMLRQAAMDRAGVFSKKELLKAYNPARAYGVEQTDYDNTGGGNHTYVRGQTVAVGVVPIEKSVHAQAADLLSAAAEADPKKGGPQLFAWIYWNGDLMVEVENEKIILPEEEAPEEGADAEGAEGAAEKDGEKKDGEEKDAEKKPAEKKPADKKTADKKKRGGKKDALEEDPEEPVGPRIEKTRTFLPGDPAHPYFLGIVTGRLALFEMKARGPELLGYLPVQTAAGQKEDAAVIVKEKLKDITKRGESLRRASMDGAKGFVSFRIAFDTRSKTSTDIFLVDVVLKVKGRLTGTWRGYKE